MKNELKTYVLMLSKVFPSTHPKSGIATGFKDKFLVSKFHTIRTNIPLWEKRAVEINFGHAVLSVRQWSGKPYEKGSHQIEIARLTKLYTQRVVMGASTKPFRQSWAYIDDGLKKTRYIDIQSVATNDGLSLEDFVSWFNLYENNEPYRGVILHCTDMRY